jgi:hypothetical protein
MADVYLNSELNIAASVGINSHQGLFKHRNPLKISPCIIHTSRVTAPKLFASHSKFSLYRYRKISPEHTCMGLARTITRTEGSALWPIGSLLGM